MNFFEIFLMVVFGLRGFEAGYGSFGWVIPGFIRYVRKALRFHAYVRWRQW